MTLNALPATAPAKAGCGCGGRGSGGCGGGGCGGGAGTASALAATAFVRPRFFAGQLLTEDDLGLLTAYTTAKDRLHNRYLFGAGVVCGLWVSCDPCGGDTVEVQPGYALDCCGNDLVLACPATLDVNAMIRDLRAAQLGKDCGDPCADQGTQSGGRQETGTSRHYCLYARYGEQDTDPVAPYDTGEPCGQTACEPTRTREGISFILKCPKDPPPLDDLWSRLRACLPGKDTIRQMDRLSVYGGPMTVAAGAEAQPPTFGQEDADELGKLLAKPADARQAAGEDQVPSQTEQVRKLAAILAKYDLAENPPQLDGVPKARAQLRDATAALAGKTAATWDDPLDQAAVDALLAQAAQLADPAASLPVPQLAMLAQGRPLSDPVLDILRSDAVTAQQWLLARLDSDPMLADCELRCRAEAMSLSTTAKGDEAVLRSLGSAGSELAELLIRFVTDCVCAALNPPCTPCDDTDVLLACLEVRDCKVVRICNADRDYVISGTALRYWLPVGELHRVIESFCCRARFTRGPARKASGQLAFDETGFGISEPTAGVPWKLLGLQEPTDLLRRAFQRADVVLAAPPAPPTASAAAYATAQQVTVLAKSVTELTRQLTDTQTQLNELTSQLPASASPATASPGTAGGSPASTNASATSASPASTGTASTGPASADTAATRAASAGRRGTGAKRPADPGNPPAGRRSRAQPAGDAKAPAGAGAPTAAGGGRRQRTGAKGAAGAEPPPADPGAAAGMDTPEAGDGA